MRSSFSSDSGAAHCHHAITRSDEPVTSCDSEVTHTSRVEIVHHTVADLPADSPTTSRCDSSALGENSTQGVPDAGDFQSTEAPRAEVTLGQYTDLDVLLSRLDDDSSSHHYEVFSLFAPHQYSQN